MNENNIKVGGKNNRVTVNLYEANATKMEITQEEYVVEVEKLRGMDQNEMVKNYIANHEITYLDQIMMSDVLMYSDVILMHQLTRDSVMRSLSEVMVKELELIGYPAGTKIERLTSYKVRDATAISVFTNTPVIVFYRAMAAAKKALKSMKGDNLRTIDMTLFKNDFNELYKAGMEILKGKDNVANSLKVLIEEYLGEPYETFDELAKMSKDELVEFFTDRKVPSKG